MCKRLWGGSTVLQIPNFRLKTIFQFEINLEKRVDEWRAVMKSYHVSWYYKVEWKMKEIESMHIVKVECYMSSLGVNIVIDVRIIFLEGIGSAKYYSRQALCSRHNRGK